MLNAKETSPNLGPVGLESLKSVVPGPATAAGAAAAPPMRGPLSYTVGVPSSPMAMSPRLQRAYPLPLPGVMPVVGSTAPGYVPGRVVAPNGRPPVQTLQATPKAEGRALGALAMFHSN